MTLNLTLHPPRIEGDTVWFTWDDDLPFPPPPDGGLFYRYEGLNLGKFSDELWMELFLALRLRSYMLLGRPIAIRLPFPVPRRVADFWLTYYSADNVSISPLTGDPSYGPWRDRPPTSPTIFDAAVYFGGGLDSLSTACLLGEFYERNRVLLIQFIDPHKPGAQRRQKQTERYERLSLAPVRSLGYSTQRIWTNLHALAFSDGSRTYEPHLEQYTVAALPVLLEHGIPLSTFCYSWLEYIWNAGDGGKLVERYPRSRPEMLEMQTRHYARVIEFPHRVTNLNLPSTTLVAFRILAHRYPDAAPYTMTCQRSPNRWCNACYGCTWQGLMRMETQINDEHFNLDYMLAESRFLRPIIAHAISSPPPAPGENGDWTPLFFTPLTYTTIATSLYRIDLSWARPLLSEEAWANLLILKAIYGERDNLLQDLVPLQAFEWLPAEIASFLEPIIGQHAIVQDLQHVPLQLGEGIVHDTFSQKFHHPLLNLPHVQYMPA